MASHHQPIPPTKIHKSSINMKLLTWDKVNMYVQTVRKVWISKPQY
jgi:hypothetical protein